MQSKFAKLQTQQKPMSFIHEANAFYVFMITETK